MKTRAEILYESIDSATAPGFTNSEWGEIFSQAQYKVVFDILKDGINRNAFNRRALDPIVRMVEFKDDDGDDELIESFSDYSGTVAKTVLATDTEHGLTTGDRVYIYDPTSSGTGYEGIHTITVVDADTFYFSATYTVSAASTLRWSTCSIWPPVNYSNGWVVNVEDTTVNGIDEKNNVWWPLFGIAELEEDSTTYSDIRVEPIQYSEYMINKDNPFKKPDRSEYIWFLTEDSSMVVITGGEDLKKLKLEFVENLEKYPISSSEDCVLHKAIHPRIVEAAVSLAHAAVQDQVGFQLQTIENQNPVIP